MATYSGVDPDDFTKIQKIFSKLEGQKTENFLKEVGKRLVSDFQMGFKMGVSPAGVPWAPLKHRVGQPLVDKKILQRSILYRLPTPKSLEVGTNVPYAKTHQYGDNSEIKVNVKAHTKLINQAFGKPLKFGVYANVKAHSKEFERNIPARPFLGIEARQKQKIVNTWNKHIKLITNGEASAT